MDFQANDQASTLKKTPFINPNSHLVRRYLESFKNEKMKTLKVMPMLFLAAAIGFQSCKKEEMEPETPPVTPTMQSSTYDYEFNNGQVVATAAYDGQHMDNLTAKMMVEEISSTQCKITVTLMNTIDGEMYMMHAHDAMDPNMTPNGTPYNETPNSNVFVQMVTGNGGTVSANQLVNMSFSDITASYNGFFVIHDPLQAVSTTDISTYLVVGSFARTQAATNYSSADFMYDFNTGQIAPAYAYNGAHANTLNGHLRVQELGDGTSRISVMLNNTINGEMYMVHAHDAMDPNMTPNGTPYNETPNSNICTVMIDGNGTMAGASQMSTMSFNDITTMYDGFFVVHDPLQAVSTTDPTTYVLLGLFAR